MTVLRRDAIAKWCSEYADALAEAVSDSTLDKLLAALVEERARRAGREKPQPPPPVIPPRSTVETFFGGS